MCLLRLLLQRVFRISHWHPLLLLIPAALHLPLSVRPALHRWLLSVLSRY